MFWTKTAGTGDASTPPPPPLCRWCDMWPLVWPGICIDYMASGFLVVVFRISVSLCTQTQHCLQQKEEWEKQQRSSIFLGQNIGAQVTLLISSQSSIYSCSCSTTAFLNFLLSLYSIVLRFLPFQLHHSIPLDRNFCYVRSGPCVFVFV